LIIGEGYTAGTGEKWKGSWFTVAHILFNKINLTDINICLKYLLFFLWSIINC